MPNLLIRFPSGARWLAIAATILVALRLCVQAADKAGAKDLLTISRFKNAEIVEYQALEYDEAVLPVKPVLQNPPPAGALLRVEGKVTSIT